MCLYFNITIALWSRRMWGHLKCLFASITHWTVNQLKYYCESVGGCGQGWHSRYSNSLRTWWPGDRILVGVRFSTPIQAGPRARPASYTMGITSFPVVKRPGRVDHPTPSSAMVKERVELYLYSTSGPSWSVMGGTLSVGGYLPVLSRITVFLLGWLDKGTTFLWNISNYVPVSVA